MPALRVVDRSEPGIRRIRRGRGFIYVQPNGRPVVATGLLGRIRALAIPPAWREVWICPLASGHIQATGQDAAGRTQYIYHPAYRADREAEKFGRLAQFARALPELRRRVAADLADRSLTRAKVLAAIVHLLDRSALRVGNRTYAETNKSFGATTLRRRHASVAGNTVTLDFRGKSGKQWTVSVRDRRVAGVIRECQRLSGPVLFQYEDPDGQRRAVSSHDVNSYLRESTRKAVSAKDFRTWSSTVLCAKALAGAPSATSRQRLARAASQAIKAVAGELRNTPAVCRKSYIHPAVLKAFEDGRLSRRKRALAVAASQRATPTDLDGAERAVLSLISRT